MQSIFCIHNIAYQGVFSSADVRGVPTELQALLDTAHPAGAAPGGASSSAQSCGTLVIRPDGTNSAATSSQINACQLGSGHDSVASHEPLMDRARSAEGRSSGAQRAIDIASTARSHPDHGSPCSGPAAAQRGRASDFAPDVEAPAQRRISGGGAAVLHRSDADASASIAMDIDASSAMSAPPRRHSAGPGGASEPAALGSAAPLSVTRHAGAAIAHHSSFPAAAEARSAHSTVQLDVNEAHAEDELEEEPGGGDVRRLKPRPRLVNWLLAGIRGASAVATVSPSYAREVRSAALSASGLVPVTGSSC